MAETSRIRFERAENCLELTLTSRPFPDAELDWDRDAIDATVDVKAGAFEGKFATTVWSHELACLRMLLEELGKRVGLSAEAAFRFREATIRLAFKLDKLGHLDIQVTTCEDPASDVRLDFSIAADQTYLPFWIDSIDAALREFPQQVETGHVQDPLHFDY